MLVQGLVQLFHDRRVFSYEMPSRPKTIELIRRKEIKRLHVAVISSAFYAGQQNSLPSWLEPAELNMSACDFRYGKHFLRDASSVVFGILFGFALSIVIPDIVLPPGFFNNVSEYTDSPKSDFIGTHLLPSVPVSSPHELSVQYGVEISRSMLYVGVLSAGRFLRTRIAACNRTWGQDLPARDIQFFVGTPPTEPYSESSVVTLKDVSDHEYPPQRKAFRMLQYMCDHYLDKYNWFLRADDDAYFRVEKIKKWLSQRDPNVKYYIGQAGYGRDLDKGRLHLPGDDNFCMGGPGVIMSRASMKGICPYIESCMQDNVTRSTGEEDVEIGRCFTKHLSVLCTSAYEFMDLFYHSYPQEYNVHPYLYIDARATKVFQNALTLHHLKLSYVMYDVHSYFTAKLRKEWWDASLALRITSQKLSDAHLKNSPITLSVAELPSLMPLETVEPLTSAATLTATDSSQAPLEFESSDWIYSDPSASVDLSSRGVLGPSESKALLGRITDITRRAITQEKMRFEKVLRVWSHSDPSGGIRYFVEASVQRFLGRNALQSTYQVELHQFLDGPEMQSVAASAPDDSEVLIILPITLVHFPFLQRFMKMYELNFLAGQSDIGAEAPGKAHLYVVVFPDANIDVKGFEKRDGTFDPSLVVSLYQTKYPHVHMHVASTTGPFSARTALQLGLEYINSGTAGRIQQNSVILMTSVDLQLSPSFVADCQNRVHQQEAAIFPVVTLKACTPNPPAPPAADTKAAGAAANPAAAFSASAGSCHPTDDVWLKSSFMHMCSSHRLLSSRQDEIKRSSGMDVLYGHLMSLVDPSSAANKKLQSPSVYRVYDSSLKIEPDFLHGQCAALVSATSATLASEIFPACSSPDLR